MTLPSKTRLSVTTLACLTASLLLATGLSGCGGDAEEDTAEATEAVPEELQGIQQLAALEAEMKEEGAQFIEARQRVEDQTGEELGVMSLSDEQQTRLREILQSREGSTAGDVVQALLDQQDRIEQLEERIQDLRSRLPSPQIVQRGDSHLDMSIRWLVENHGLEEADARAKAQRNLLTDRMLPGFEVWHMYQDGVYGTAVTQGTARISPYLLNVRAERALTGERDQALERVGSLEAEMAILEERRDRLVEDLEGLQFEYDVLQSEADDLRNQRDDLETQVSSTYFGVDSRQGLRRSKVIGPGGRLRSFDPETFNETMDLRRDATVRVRAGSYGLSRINRIQVFPREQFEEDRDYQVEISEDAASASVTLTQPARFENKHFLVILYGPPAR